MQDAHNMLIFLNTQSSGGGHCLRGNETFGAQVDHYGVSIVDYSGPLFAAQAFWSMPCEKKPLQVALPWTRASYTTRLSLT